MACSLSLVESSALLLASAFKNFVEKRGNAERMSKCEFKDFVKEHCPVIFEASERKDGGFNELFKTLDFNRSGDICLSEFTMLIGAFIGIFYDALKECEQQTVQSK